jgi:hypothetical protein
MRRLQLANQWRRRRADDKKALRKRELNAIDILDNYPDHWRNAKCVELLLTIPAIGSTKAERMMRTCSISHSRSLSSLTEHQRERLRKAIMPYCVA